MIVPLLLLALFLFVWWGERDRIKAERRIDRQRGYPPAPAPMPRW